MESNQTELQQLLNEYLSNHPGGEEQLARACDVSRPTIIRWAKGETSPSRVVLRMVISILKGLLRGDKINYEQVLGKRGVIKRSHRIIGPGGKGLSEDAYDINMK